MAFTPNVGQELHIDGAGLRVAPHPGAPRLPYGQTGRQGTVYRLDGPAKSHALKVFNVAYRVPRLAGLAQQLAPFAELPGLAVCRRNVLTRPHHEALLAQYPDLAYAMLMPWIAGPTWLDIMYGRQAISATDSLTLARALVEVLTAMEEEGLAHCDLANANIILPLLNPDGPGSEPLTLVDVEQMYGPGLERPTALPSGTLGYTHRAGGRSLWSPAGDRFAGAILLAEILCWCDGRVRAAAWGETYFEPPELQQAGDRVRTLETVLGMLWDREVLRLFRQCWNSDSLADCPTFGEWLVSLPDRALTLPHGDIPVSVVPAAPPPHPTPPPRVRPPAPTTGPQAAPPRPMTPPGRPPAEVPTERRGSRPAAPPLGSQPAPKPPPVAPPLPVVPPPTGAGAPVPVPRSGAEIRLTAGAQWEHPGAGGLAYAPDGRTLAVAGAAGVTLLNAAGLTNPRCLLGGTWAGCVAYAPDGRTLAAGSLDGTVRLWATGPGIESTRPTQTLSGHAGWVRTLTYAPDSQTLATGDDRGQIHLWAADGTRRRKIAAGRQSVYCLAWAPNGQTLVAGYADGTVCIWRVGDGTLLQTIPPAGGPVWSLALAPDGEVGFSGEADGRIRLWRTTNGRTLHEVHGHQGAVYSLICAPSGDWLASGGEDGTIRIWQARNGARLGQIAGHSGWVRALAIAPQAPHLSSVGRDHTVRLWTTAP
ncbi:MAG: WD40 repeat domain-containing protein [Chloroflexota bacterium]|nr:WD40 repeat domain-containing protein [Chloroflexota bacterium]